MKKERFKDLTRAGYMWYNTIETIGGYNV